MNGVTNRRRVRGLEAIELEDKRVSRRNGVRRADDLHARGRGVLIRDLPRVAGVAVGPRYRKSDGAFVRGRRRIVSREAHEGASYGVADLLGLRATLALALAALRLQLAMRLTLT